MYRLKTTPKSLPEWRKLARLAAAQNDRYLADELVRDRGRFARFSHRFEHLLLDLSKQPLNVKIEQTLLALAQASGLKGGIEKLFSGAAVNGSEQRAALHSALRAPAKQALRVDGVDLNAQVHRSLNKMARMVKRLHGRQWPGCTGAPLDTLVNIGVGGSDLGPQMACHALAEFAVGSAPNIHFVSCMDGSELARLLPQLNPHRTIFVLASKSFTTADTLANATTARQWLAQGTGRSQQVCLKRHFIGISCNLAAMTEWGIPVAHQLEIWDWVGGRYSLWSAIGFAIAAQIGLPGFRDMLAGAHSMDEHFRCMDFAQNLPVLLALSDIWNSNFHDIESRAVLPYDGRLMHLPAYLQQLEMESNGKGVTQDGKVVGCATAPIVWGAVGPNAQHAFYQLLHQGTRRVACELIAAIDRPASADNPAMAELAEQHRLTLANFLAQSRILAMGDAAAEEATALPHRRYRGGQPCTSLLLDSLNPRSLGQLIALYEHKVFVQSVIWKINPFDQWGVELGKRAAAGILPALQGEPASGGLDSSTVGLLAAMQRK